MATMFTAIAAAASSGAATVLPGIFGGAAAGGAGAAAAGATGAAASSTVGLSQLLSAGSALAAIGQGFTQRNQLRDQAAMASAQAEQETAAGAAAGRDLSREYAELRSEQQAVQLANGLDIGIGTPVSIGESTKRLAERNLDVTRQNAGNRSAMARLRSRGLMSEARSSVISGFGRAATIGADAYQLTG